MTEQGKFKCLRCGLDYTAPFNPELEPQERSCPKCRSNSVRHLKEKKHAPITENTKNTKKQAMRKEEKHAAYQRELSVLRGGAKDGGDKK